MLRKIIILTIAVVGGAFILPGVRINNLLTAILLAIVLIILNATVKPILTAISLPITVVTLGLFLIVINIFIIYLADWILPGFDVTNWVWAGLFALIISLITSLLDRGETTKVSTAQ